MEKGQTFVTISKIVLWTLFLGFFLFFLFQIDNIERSLLKIRQEISDLKRNQRFSNVSSSPVATQESQRKYLHPELPNFLEPDPFNYVCEEAVMKGKLDGTLVQRWPTDPKGFNFIIENDGSLRQKLEVFCIEPAAYDHWNDPEKYAPRAAERIEVLDDYKTWIFYFRRGMRWHRPSLKDWSDPQYRWLKEKLDKEEQYVTAYDFAFYLDMVLSPQVQSGHLKNYYEKVKEYKVLDDYCMVVHWSEKQYQSVSAMTQMFRPLPRFIYEYDKEGNKIPKENVGTAFNTHWFNYNVIGCGAYQFVSHEPGVSIKLTRNESYWGPKPNIKDLVYLIYRDSKQVLLKMKSKEQDLADVIIHEYVVDENKNPDSPFSKGDILVKEIPVVGYTYIGWNGDHPLFSDKRVRRAMTHALNRKDILKNIVLGLGILTTGPFYPDSRAYNKKIEPHPFDLDEAARLLKECGWEDNDKNGILEKEINGKKINFEFSFLVWNTSEQWKTIAQIYKEDLYKIGVQMNIRALDWPVFQKMMNNKEFEAFSGYWLINYDADPYQLWHSTQADIPLGSNRVCFRNKRADEIIEEARRTFEGEKRAKLFHEFHEIMHEEQPYTFFYAPTDEMVYWKYVKNVILRKERPHIFSLPYYIDK